MRYAWYLLSETSRAAAIVIIGVIPLWHPQLDSPPNFLLIAEEQLRPNSETSYSSIERTTARLCAELNCPNPYLALASEAKPIKVLWLNEFKSAADSERVSIDYATNKALMTRLNEQSARKKPLTLPVVFHWTRYRADLSEGCTWNVGTARFYVVGATHGRSALRGCVFEAADSTRFVITQSKTRFEAERTKAAAGRGATIFRPRPLWSHPAQAWMVTDRKFWRLGTAPY